MKATKPSIIIFLALAVLAASSGAQSPTPVPSPTATPAGDPFIKKPGLPVRSSAQEMQQANPVVIYFTVEVYALSRADASKLVSENDGGEARHKAVLDLAGKGNARLELLLGNVTKMGQRSQLMQIIQVPYPTDFEPRGKNGAYPAAYEVRNTGETLEYEPVLSADGRTCNVDLKLLSVSLKGFMHYGFKIKDPQNGKPAQVESGAGVPNNASDDSFLSQPVFGSRTITTSVEMPVSVFQFLGTLNDNGVHMPDDPEKESPVRLVFGRVSTMEIKRDPKDAVASGDATSEHQLSVYSMSREAAQKILAADPQPGSYFDAVQALVKTGEAKNESLTVLKDKSGQRAIVEEGGDNIRYAREYDLKPGESDPAPSTFETERTGNSWEIEPVLGPGPGGPWVDMNMEAKLVRRISDWHPDGVARNFEGPPMLEKRSIITAFAASIGEETFVGTFTPPGDAGVPGVKDDGRVWLAFVRTTVPKP